MFDWLFNFLGGGVLAVIVPIIIIALLFAYATSRVKVAGANEALVRTGGVFGGAPAQLKVVRAGRVIVLPARPQAGPAPPVRAADQRQPPGRRDQAGHQGRGPGRGDGQDRRRRGVDPQRRRAVPGPRRPDRADRQERPRGVAPVDRRHADRRGAQLRPPEVPAGGPGRGQGGPRDVRPDDRQLHDPGDPRRGRLHGPHRPAGDGPPRAGRPHGQGPGRPGGRGPRGRGDADQAQRPARRRRCARPRSRR